MIYLVYRMHLSERARRNSKEFWAWLEERESWFYSDLPSQGGPLVLQRHRRCLHDRKLGRARG